MGTVAQAKRYKTIKTVDTTLTCTYRSTGVKKKKMELKSKESSNNWLLFVCLAIWMLKTALIVVIVTCQISIGYWVKNGSSSKPLNVYLESWIPLCDPLTPNTSNTIEIKHGESEIKTSLTSPSSKTIFPN